MTTQWQDRLPPIPRERMDDAQRAADDALIAGPRKGVKGPFIPLLRSPRLMDRLQRVGEYLRFDSALPPRLSELATLIVARTWTQQFEWFVHVPLALKAGVSQATVDALANGIRPADMTSDEAIVYDFTSELIVERSVGDAAYRRCVDRLGEHGVVDLTALVGYFALVSMVLNVAHTPPDVVAGVATLPPLAGSPPIGVKG
jgi:4-carboxymuconolactone decarboxylase